MTTDMELYASIQAENERLRQRVADLEQLVERQGQAGELRFRAIFDSSAVGVAFVAPDGHVAESNPAFQHLVGYSATELANMTFAQLTHPEDANSDLQLFQELLAGQRTSYKLKKRYIHKDGTIIWIRMTVVLVPAVEATPTMAMGIIENITEQKRQEEELYASEARLKAILEASPIPVTITRIADGIVLYANASLGQTLGIAHETLIGSKTSRFYVDLTHRQHIMETIACEGRVQSIEVQMKRVDGTPFWAILSSQRLMLDGQDVIYSSIHDISELKRSEQERASLQQQIIDSQRAALSVLSTPLIPLTDNAIIMPLVGTIDSTRAQQIMEVLLEGIARHQAAVAILDITGVQVVDTQVASTLIRAAQAVKLLGAQIVLTGLQPSMAQTLVQLGVDLGGIATRGTLQAGIAYAMNGRTTLV